MSKRPAVPAKPASTRAGKSEPVPQSPKPKRLKTDVELFLKLYVVNGFNASAAYQEVHPAVTSRSARTNGWRLLANADVKARLKELVDADWKTRQVSPEEVLARIGLDATADPRQLVDEHGFALGLHELGDEIASSIESVEFEGGKLKKVKLASKTIARRTILEVTGKVNGGNDVDRLADALRETLTRSAGRE